MDDLTTKRCFDSQATCVIDELGSFFDMLSMGVFTTKHRQTSGWLEQGLNAYTVAALHICTEVSRVFNSVRMHAVLSD